MIVSVSAIADYASISEGGKLNILGIFDSIRARAFPARHTAMVFAFRLRADYADGGTEHAVTVHLEDEDGTKSFTVEMHVGIPRVEPGMFSHNNQVLNLRDLVFRRAGRYTMKITIDGEVRAEHPFLVEALTEVS